MRPFSVRNSWAKKYYFSSFGLIRPDKQIFEIIHSQDTICVMRPINYCMVPTTVTFFFHVAEIPMRIAKVYLTPFQLCHISHPLIWLRPLLLPLYCLCRPYWHQKKEFCRYLRQMFRYFLRTKIIRSHPGPVSFCWVKLLGTVVQKFRGSKTQSLIFKRTTTEYITWTDRVSFL